ncbi:MAG: DUF885 domain-containing protein [Planctomycetales bacterium]|nr:DUF885 domain-containing protein [Planctomycetales bacterium]
MPHSTFLLILLVALSGLSFAGSLAVATEPLGGAGQSVAPTLDELDTTLPLMPSFLARIAADESSLRRFEGRAETPATRTRSRRFHEDWLKRLSTVDFDQLDQAGRIDYLLLQNRLRRELRSLEFEAQREAETDEFVPFAKQLDALHDQRMAKQPVDGKHVAKTLNQVSLAIDEAKTVLSKREEVPIHVARRTVQRLERLGRTLQSWHQFYDGYDPIFSWWVEQPYKQTIEKLAGYRELIDKRFIGIDKDKDKIVGDPIGRDALLADLAFEMIPYSPEELVELANREFAWCEKEYLRAANDLGLGDDWRAALEHVKSRHVEPGKQPELIRQLAAEAEAFLDERELVTIPLLCRHSWRMNWMSPERQKVNPYFTGGEVISISFPTNTMDHADKLMSLRGNNVHFSRATVHHELIPGHHLQGFMADRYNTQRQIFRTPFYIEGWALYWEMLLWDLDFHQSAEDRIGMLFWRSHRCARIIFSLSYHLGQMSADEAVDFLVERVGHERRNAEGEVRRSVEGSYEPLYQAAYMLGGLQLRRLREELVESGKMSHREFHDAVLRENAIPIEMVRASLTGQPLTKDYQPQWRFYSP